MQIPPVKYRSYSLYFKNCLATIGVCVFCAAAPAVALFIYGGSYMPDYKKLYLSLFNDVSDVIKKLQKVQQESEERYLSSCENEGDETQKRVPLTLHTSSQTDNS